MSKTPIVRPVSWLNAAISLGVLALFVAVGYRLNEANGVAFGAISYVALAILLRSVVARHHRNAIRHCKRGEYEQAIPEFEKSAVFFLEHRWIDRFRAITMLSAAGMSYREMALVSLGFCYAQIGAGDKARQSYGQCLSEFPTNAMARSALRLMDAGAQERVTGSQTHERSCGPYGR